MYPLILEIFTDDVIDVIAKEEKIAKCLHLPLQSGSSQILKRMNRGYTKEQYLSLAHKIQNRIPGVALTTDIIVGFPGETEQDFLDTLEVVREINYDNAFMFMYSIRQGTRAATMQEQVPEDTKKERLQKLMDVQARCSYKESQKYQGKVVRVLVEGESKKNKQVLSGRTSTNKIVLFQAPISLKGSFVDVEIYECKTWTLYGKLV
ncbi:(Dimethylallyl)adenosine tRNA methylthiotransferase miaB [Fusobacterium necrophorum subsp. funduliforme 1_1_36S]|nr:(Dimethylallyl)adenosine tRNA methylthiotransferase miaB [Fusobacterium necrophorum subsp. funduliforme 1_1_36S]